MKSLAKVFTLTKNEYDLIEDFLIYYGSIFGYSNIVIIDNGSTMQQVHNVYEIYKRYGVTVYHDHRSMNDMSQIMTEYICKHKSECEYVLPLDTDEFIFKVDRMHEAEYILDPDDIRRYLLSVPENYTVLRYGKFLGSIVDLSDKGYVSGKFERPARNMTKFFDQGWDKIIIRSDAFCSIASGNHSCNVLYGERMIAQELGLLHYHESGPKRVFERCIQSIIGYRQFDVEMPIDAQMLLAPAFVTHAGGHRVRQYLIFLKKMFIINTFIQLVGRCATKEDIEKYSQFTSPYDIYSHITSNIRSLKDVKLNIDNIEDYTENLIFSVEKDNKDAQPLCIKQVYLFFEKLDENK